VATALHLAASCLQRSQSALGAFFRRMNARVGTPKAITATAHTLARLISTMLKHGTAYVRQRLADDEPQYQDRILQHVTRRAKALGYALVKTPTGAPMSCSRPRSSSSEGPHVSRDRLPLGAECCGFFSAFSVLAQSAVGVVS
jgi:hypothetical protein